MTLDGTNTWVLGAGREAIIVDPGPDDVVHREAIVRLLDQRSLEPRMIVLTHGHPDHSEGAATLAQQLRCGVRAVDPAFVLGDEGLTPGSVIEADGFTLEVLLTPGHTADSASLVLRESGANGASVASILTGDTVLGRGTTVVAHPDGRLDDYLTSLGLLREACEQSGASMVLPGHGPALEQPIEVIDYYVGHREQRLAQVVAALDELAELKGQPNDLAQAVVERVYVDVPRAVWPAALLSVRAQLEYLRQIDALGVQDR
jgi:glyoxylase-like metal-dependent hydrolase (beta-lactamase superfamily II)